MNEEKKVFKAGAKGEVKCVQWGLKVRIRDSKEDYRRKLEGNLQSGMIREVWKQIRKSHVTNCNVTNNEQ